MSTVTQRAIWDAFCVKVNSFIAQLSPAIPPIHQGVNGAPPDAGDWVETRFFPQKTAPYGLADDDVSDYRGFCQLSVCTRDQNGLDHLHDLADAFVEYCDKGTMLGPVQVTEKPSQSATPIVSPGRTSIMVSVYYSGQSVG